MEVTRVLIVGHSYISRLNGLLNQDLNFPNDFNLIQCDIKLYGVSGAHVTDFQNDRKFWGFMDWFQPHIVILQVGGNDLCSHNLRPETLACQLVDLLKIILEFSSVRVGFICELFKRNKPRYVTEQEYSRRRVIVNDMLPILIEDIHVLNATAIYWKHLRLMESPLKIYDDDGVHLTFIGNLKFYRSIRLAIMHALKSIQQNISHDSI